MEKILLAIVIQFEHDWEQGILIIFIQEKLNDFEANSDGLVKALVNMSSIPIIAINDSSIITLVSNSVLEVFGYSREELIGHNVRI
jgi:PAS domain-containing protein